MKGQQWTYFHPHSSLLKNQFNWILEKVPEKNRWALCQILSGSSYAWAFSFETTANLEGSRGAIYQPSRPHRPWTVAGTCLLQTAVSNWITDCVFLERKAILIALPSPRVRGEKEPGESGTSSRIFQWATTSCLILFAGFRSDFPWDYTYWTESLRLFLIQFDHLQNQYCWFRAKITANVAEMRVPCKCF